MAETTSTQSSATTQTTTLPPSSLTSAIDTHSVHITQHRLNGTNFRDWFQSVLLVIQGKGKTEYLDGAYPQPSPDAINYGTWVAENSIVMAWLINSMEPKIGRTYLHYKTARDIWTTVQELYSAAQCFEIRSTIRTTTQGSSTVTEHYTALTELWQEMDSFYEIKWHCTADSIQYNPRLEKERGFDFLHGPNKDLDEVRGHLLGSKPLPSLRDAFAEVQREESRKRVMLTSPPSSILDLSSQASALASSQNNSASPRPMNK